MGPNDSILSPKSEPKARTDHSVGIVKRKLIMYGGVDNFDSYLNHDFWKYDIHWKSWLKIDAKFPLISDCYFSDIVAVDNGLYMIGFENSFVGNRMGKVISYYDYKTNRWICVTVMSDIHLDNDDRSYFVSSMFHYENSLYIFAQIPHNEIYNVIYKYSLLTKNWSSIEQKGIPPKIMDRITGSVFDNKYYCFGDTNIFKTGIFQGVYIFDLKTHEWTHTKTYPDFEHYPSDRINTSLSFNKTHGFLSGGLTRSREILDDIWSIDLQSLKWHKFKFVRIKNNKTLESKVMSHASAIYDNSTLLLFGGIIYGMTKVNKLQKYFVETPSLYKFSLYALMKNNEEDLELGEVPIAIIQDIFYREESTKPFFPRNKVTTKSQRKRLLN